MTDRSGERDRGPGDDPRVTVHAGRRIDPTTGAVRAPVDTTGAETAPQQEEVEVTDSAIGGVPTSGTDVAGDDTRSTDDSSGVEILEGLIETPGERPADGASETSDELGRVQAELAERTADLQRVSAEYANYRRRIDRDRDATVAGAKAQVAGELMTVLDDVDRAGAHGDLTGPFKVVADRLTETLHRVGLTPFGLEGDPFDPSVHEAVAQESSAEVSGPTVTTVMRRGYRFADRVLRPAMVAVTDRDPSAGPAPEAASSGSQAAGTTDPDAS